jgi:drug/metabolite transporter (DMT)-like permease
MKLKTVLLFAALCFIWGSTWFASRVLVEQIPPVRGASIRCLIGAILLVPFVVTRNPNFPRGRALAANLILSGTMIAVPYAVIFWTQSRISPGMTAILFAVTPLVAGLFGNFIDGPPLPQNAMYALILGVAGIVLLLSGALSISLGQVVGVVVILFAVVSVAISSVYAKRELAQIDPMISTLFQLSGAAILLFSLSVFFESGEALHWTPASLGAVLFLGIVSSAVGYSLYFWLLKGIEPWQIGTIQWFEPMIAIFQGALLLREPLTWRMVGGSVILVVSVVRVLTAHGKDDEAVTLQITGKRSIP